MSFNYPEAVKFAEDQGSVIWFDTQFNVEKDVQGNSVDFEAQAKQYVSNGGDRG